MPGTTPRLEERLSAVSAALCGALRGAICSALDIDSGGADGELRPVQLTAGLGLDKSLASRVVRSLAVTDPLRALLGIPTPQGLALIARAADEKGADKESLQRLDAAASSYGEVLAEFSGGRTDLEATLAGWIPEQRARAERDARRSVFRGMTTLSGTRASAVYNSIYLVPSDVPGKVDSLLVAVRQDMRRLRAGAQMLVACLAADSNADDWREKRSTLGGAPLDDDVRALVLDDLCSHPIPKLEMDASDRRLLLTVASDSLDVNEFATLGFGWRTKAHFDRHGGKGRSWGHLAFQTAWPTEALVVDLFVHHDLVGMGPPVTSIDGSAADGVAPAGSPPARDSWQRASAPALLDLKQHPSGLSSPRVRKCRAISENGCREAGLSQGSFAVYRTTLEFPVAGETLRLWWPLQPR